MPDTTTAPTIAERVAAGAAFLDQAEPGWRQHIDIDRLDLASPCRCVLGQLEIALHSEGPEDDGAFSDALFRYGIAFEEWALGFNAGHEGRNVEFPQLTAAWRELIQARREAQP